MALAAKRGNFMGFSFTKVEGRSLLDYICPSDQQRWLDVADQLGAESPAKALSLRLETQDTSKEVRLYHVDFPLQQYFFDFFLKLRPHLSHC